MLRWLYYFVFGNATIELAFEAEDAELDVENTPIMMIERFSGQTVFTVIVTASGKTRDYSITCTLEKHAEFVARFRKRLGLPEDKTND